MCRGMEMLWSPDASSWISDFEEVDDDASGFPPSGFPPGGGMASSNNAALPHCGTTHSGASRSVAPDRLRRATRFADARNKASLNWYLSMNSADGSVRYVCSLHVGSGADRSALGRVRVRVGCRPEGRSMEVL